MTGLNKTEEGVKFTSAKKKGEGGKSLSYGEGLGAQNVQN